MLPIDWKLAIQYAQLVNLAYEVLPTGDDNQLTSALAALNLKYLHTLYANELATDIDPHLGQCVSFGFLAVSESGELIAAIRGTETIWEWMHDASFLMVPSVIQGVAGLTEDGFTDVYRSLRIDKTAGAPTAIASIATYLSGGTASKVTVCGHSLGAALATLLTADVAANSPCRTPVSYTYASPRTGDHIFANSYNALVPATYRVANRQDLVPQLPPILPLPYEHVNTLYALVPPPNAINLTIPCMHYLSTYLWLMGKQAGVDAGPLNAACAAAVPPGH
ncbi:MAG TPA: lipase family protein [Bryobacteraceae bacterium]|nr:lipase family protein [Bryobacteraceae bacterium]